MAILETAKMVKDGQRVTVNASDVKSWTDKGWNVESATAPALAVAEIPADKPAKKGRKRKTE